MPRAPALSPLLSQCPRDIHTRKRTVLNVAPLAPAAVRRMLFSYKLLRCQLVCSSEEPTAAPVYTAAALCFHLRPAKQWQHDEQLLLFVSAVAVRCESALVMGAGGAGAQVVGRLDIVEPKIVQFFRPAAEKVMGSADPTAAMAAALAALAGVTTVPKPRSLLAQVRPPSSGIPAPKTFLPELQPAAVCRPTAASSISASATAVPPPELLCHPGCHESLSILQAVMRQLLSTRLAAEGGAIHVSCKAAVVSCGCLQDEGSITIRIMTKKPARVTNPGSIFGILRNVLNRDASNYVGKIRMLLDQPEGNGARRPVCLHCPRWRNAAITCDLVRLQFCLQLIISAPTLASCQGGEERGAASTGMAHFLPAHDTVKIRNLPSATASFSLLSAPLQAS